jgi:hypothetical protein
MKLRSKKMKRTPVPIISTVVVLCFAVSSALAGTRSVQRLTVVDNGKTVADWQGIEGDGNQTPVFNVIALQVRHQLLILGVTRAGFLGTDNQLYFTSNDCSGVPYFAISVPFPAPLPDTALRTAVAGTNVYTAAGDSQAIVVNSVLAGLNTPGNSYCLQYSFAADALPSDLTIDLRAQFTPPYAVVPIKAESQN